MELIRTSRQIGQAVKNVARLRQIIAVFARHGFSDVVNRMELGRYLPARFTPDEASLQQTMPERLRRSFEELGPSFVKFGQLLSTRPDLLPEAYIEELTRLQDDVRALPIEKIRTVVEAELKKPLGEAFSAFSETPLAAASVSQVHAARLPSGEEVVVKVQRPGIDRMIENDVSILAFIAGLLERYVPETRVIAPRTIVDEFFRTLRYELDFAVEANNTVRMAESMRDFPDIVIPTVHRSLSTHKVLTMSRIEGIRANDRKAIAAAGIDTKKVVELGARAFFKTVMIDGFFHGDLHGGNWFILPGSRLGIIDYGIVGRLSEKSRDLLAEMVFAILQEDYEKLCYHYAELGAAAPSIDFESFQREVRNTLSPYLGLSLKDIDVGKVLVEATKIAANHDVRIPGDWMIVFKAILTVESVGRMLDPDFDFLAIGRDLAKDLVKNQYSWERIRRDLLWMAKDGSQLLQILPRQLRWMFRRLAANDYAIEVRSPQVDRLREQLDLNGRRLSASVLVAGLFIASSLALNHVGGARFGDYPVISVAFFLLGCFFLLGLFYRSFKR